MGQNQAIGSSRGGLKTKIVALLDALGNLSRFVLLPGQRHDSIGVEPLIMRKLKNRLWSVALVAQIEVIKAPQVQLTAQLQSINERPTSCQHPRHLPPGNPGKILSSIEVGGNRCPTRNGMAASTRTPNLPEATLVCAVSAVSRHPAPGGQALDFHR